MNSAALKHNVWMWMGRHVSLLPLFRLYASLTRKSIRIVDRRCEVVIEGYPRSANTFALVAFRLAQGREVEVAHHVHGPAQVLRAVSIGIPVIVLIRHPMDAVASLVTKMPMIAGRDALVNYINFYEQVWSVRGGFVLAPFEAVTQDMGKVIERVNEVFKTDFKNFHPSDENLNKCFAMINALHKRGHGLSSVDHQQVARPSDERAKILELRKQELAESVDRWIVHRALATYEKFTRQAFYEARAG